MSRSRMIVAAVLAAFTIGAGAPPAMASDEQVVPGPPLWVYGHSYTTNPGNVNTPGQEWMPELAGRLQSPTWQTFGVGSSRLIDTYSDIARWAPRGPVPGSAWDGRRGGVVVLQSEMNDMINPWGASRDARPLSSQALGNYEQTLQASLAMLASERRQDWSRASSGGAWKGARGSAYLGGELTYTTQRGAYREMQVEVGESGVVWVITWEPSSRVRNSHTGSTAIAVDGATVAGISARTAPWAAVYTRRAGGYLHAVGPRATAVTGLTPGVHTIRVTKTDPGPGAVYLDQLLVQSADPVPVVVMKDPPAYTRASAYTAASGPRINANRAWLNRRIDGLVARGVFPNVVTATLEGIEPGDYGPDGIHLSDRGMDVEAARLEEVIEGYLSGTP
jgi:hypothetical protein